MLCKWCGAPVAERQSKCSRCGRELPAKSDCGGFYDIVPTAPRPVPSAKPVVAAPQPQPTQNKGGLWMLWAGIAFFLIGVLFLVIAANGNKGDRAAAQTGNKKENVQNVESGDESTEPKNSLPKLDFSEDPAGDHNKPIEEQKVTVTVIAQEEKAGNKVSTSLDFGSSDVTATDIVCVDNDSISSVQVDLPTQEGCIVARFDVSSKKVRADIQILEEVFGKTKGDAVYQWEYRVGKDDWKPVSGDDAVEIDPNIQGEEIQYRLTYTRESARGGSVQLVISGIVAEKD